MQPFWSGSLGLVISCWFVSGAESRLFPLHQYSVPGLSGSPTAKANDTLSVGPHRYGNRCSARIGSSISNVRFVPVWSGTIVLTPPMISVYVAVKFVLDVGRLSKAYATVPTITIVPGNQRTLNVSPDTQDATPFATFTTPLRGRSIEGKGWKLSKSNIGFAATSASSN